MSRLIWNKDRHHQRTTNRKYVLDKWLGTWGLYYCPDPGDKINHYDLIAKDKHMGPLKQEAQKHHNANEEKGGTKMKRKERYDFLVCPKCGRHLILSDLVFATLPSIYYIVGCEACSIYTEFDELIYQGTVRQFVEE